MRQFEITSPMGRELRDDEVRIVAARELGLRRNAVINVVDPAKSYCSGIAGADVECRIVRRSIDARGEFKMVYQVEARRAYEPAEEYHLPEYREVGGAPAVIVIGSGPAGLFAALRLLMEGFRPILIEQGRDVRRRKRDISALSRRGELDPTSNYCYGEGGAGTFSDGKLFTRSCKRGDIREVLYQFVEFGADRSILVDAHPHIGTDKLPRVVENIRNCILRHGGEVHFETRLVDIDRAEDGTLELEVEAPSDQTPVAGSRKVSDSGTAGRSRFAFAAQAVILATGHSSREIYALFQRKGWALEAKGFAMGVRVEHPQALIDRIRYHGQWRPGIPPAEYTFTEQLGGMEETDTDEDGRGVFSFCMCPGGILVPAATEPDALVLNGMSNSARNSKWANAGVVVQVNPEDLPQEYRQYGVFGLLEWQRAVEKSMYDYVAACRARQDGELHPFAAPAQRMIDFCEGRLSATLPETSYHPGVVSAPLHELLPAFISERLRQVFPMVHHKTMRGYYTNEALLLGVETRTSSPIRIVREEETRQCPQVQGLFPCGEGSGHAGGIVSSAIDGINSALAVSRYLDPSR